LTEAAAHWDTEGRPDGLLWRPPDLDLLNAFERRAGADMTELEVAFHRTSRARERSRRLVKRVTVSALVGLLLVVAGLGMLAEHQRRQAEEQTTLATVRELAAQANLARAARADDLPCSTLLAIESLRRRPTLEGQMAMMADLALLRPS